MSNIVSQNSNSNQDQVNEQGNVEKPGFFSNIFGKKSSDTPSSEATEKPWWKFWGGRKSKKNKSNKKRRSGKKRSNKKR